jgi:2'-5' RNA ligase
MAQENLPLTFDTFIEKAQAIPDSFPNEQVWLQGGLRPNRQLQRPEAGYCIVMRYDEMTTSPISHFMTKVRSILPPIVEYSEQNLHTSLGTYGKRDMEGFVPDLAILQQLVKSVEEGIGNRPKNLRVEFGRWLYNDEAILISGSPNQDLWQLFQNIGNACQENGYPSEMARIVHITTARFISSISRPEFEQFVRLMKSAPKLASAKPSTIDLATWHCDGLVFDIAVHRRYRL